MHISNTLYTLDYPQQRCTVLRVQQASDGRLLISIMMAEEMSLGLEPDFLTTFLRKLEEPAPGELDSELICSCKAPPCPCKDSSRVAGLYCAAVNVLFACVVCLVQNPSQILISLTALPLVASLVVSAPPPPPQRGQYDICPEFQVL